MAMNSRGQIYTIIILLLVGLVVLSFQVASFYYSGKSVRERVQSMESFLHALEDNLERQLYIAGFRSIFLAEDYITRTGTYISGDSFFQEAFFNGTVDGSPEAILDGANYGDLLNSVNTKASSLNLNVTMQDPVLEVLHVSPWFVTFRLTTEFTLKDKQNLASWNKSSVIEAHVPVQEFEDPLFTIGTLARVSRKINETPYGGHFATGSNVANLSDHTQQGYYLATPLAPSFLQRLSGNLTVDTYGIESLVYIPDLTAEGLSTSSKSVVDHIYFSGSNPVDYSISGMPAWFSLDDTNSRLDLYNVSSLAS